MLKTTHYLCYGEMLKMILDLSISPILVHYQQLKIPDLHRMLFTFDTNKEDEYLCPTCWYMESEVND